MKQSQQSWTGGASPSQMLTHDKHGRARSVQQNDSCVAPVIIKALG